MFRLLVITITRRRRRNPGRRRRRHDFDVCRHLIIAYGCSSRELLVSRGGRLCRRLHCVVLTCWRLFTRFLRLFPRFLRLFTRFLAIAISTFPLRPGVRIFVGLLGFNGLKHLVANLGAKVDGQVGLLASRGGASVVSSSGGSSGGSLSSAS